jgi:hypothetical protein
VAQRLLIAQIVGVVITLGILGVIVIFIVRQALS